MTGSEQLAPDPAPPRLSIEGELTIGRAVELMAAMLNQLEQQAGLELDLSKVTELDTAGVQLLLLAKQTAEASGKTLHLVEHSPAVREVFDLLKLDSYFGDPLSTPSTGEAVQ